MSARWYVCDMDDGVLRIERTRREAVAWWKTHTDSNTVLARYTYRSGYYSYRVGVRGEPESGSEIAIVREDLLSAYGLAIPAGGVGAIAPVFPYRDRPHEPGS